MRNRTKKQLILISALLFTGGTSFSVAIADDTTSTGSGTQPNAGPDTQGGPGGFRRRGGGGWQGMREGLGAGGDGQGGGPGGGFRQRMRGQGGGQGGQGGGWQGMRGEGGQHTPSLADIHQIPSLTQQQKDKIEGVFVELKRDTQAARQEIRSMMKESRGAGGGIGGPGGMRIDRAGRTGDQPAAAPSASGSNAASPTANAGPEAMVDGPNREKIKELKQSMRQKREDAWTKVKTILSPDQLKELEQIRNGQAPASSVKVVDGEGKDEGK